MLYLGNNYYFDNMQGLDRNKLKELSVLYQDVKLEKRLTEILRKKGGRQSADNR